MPNPSANGTVNKFFGSFTLLCKINKFGSCPTAAPMIVPVFNTT